MPINNSDFNYIRQLLRDRTGVVLGEDKAYLVESRLAKLAKTVGVNSVSGLVAQLRTKHFNPLDQQIVEALMTNETFFFRDEHPFQALKTIILPELLKRRQLERSLNIWCAACSSGQEPYSIAMLLREYFPQLASWNVKLIASDISLSILDRARAGCYAQHEVNRGLPSAFLVKYFQRSSNEWVVQEDIRKMIDFRQFNLTEDFAPMLQMDIIFLRNVLIYFDIQTKQDILTKIQQVLRPDGYLFLGGGETTINLDDSFEPLQFDQTVCYKLRRPKSSHCPVLID